MVYRLLAGAAACVALALPAAAAGYPPITCGRVHVGGKAYVVRSHGPACGKALSWTRGFIAQHRSPAGFTCKAYGADVPAVCIRKGHKNTYFNATKA